MTSYSWTGSYREAHIEYHISLIQPYRNNFGIDVAAESRLMPYYQADRFLACVRAVEDHILEHAYTRNSA